MHAFYMEPMGPGCTQLGPVYTCVCQPAATAAHQAATTPLHIINHSAASTNQLITTNNNGRQSRTLLPVSYGPPNPVYGGMEAVWHTEFQRLFSKFYGSHYHVWFLCPTGPPPTQSSPVTATNSTPPQPSPPSTLQLPHTHYEATALGLALHPSTTPIVLGPPQSSTGIVGDLGGVGGQITSQQRWQTYLDSAKVRFCCQECGHGWTSMKGRVAFWFNFNISNGQGTLMFRLYGQKCQRCKSGHYENAMWYPEEVVKVLTNVYSHVGQVYYGLYQLFYTKSRRAGKPRTPHNSTLCQACQDGVCAERR